MFRGAMWGAARRLSSLIVPQSGLLRTHATLAVERSLARTPRPAPLLATISRRGMANDAELRRRLVSDVQARRRNRRFWAIAAGLCAAGTALFFLLDALRDNLMFYITPTELMERKDEYTGNTKRFRLGGLVREGSVKMVNDPPAITFAVTDLNNEVMVRFAGIVPDLFGEGSGVVCEGVLTEEGNFEATEVLAKHDENYMPRDVAEAVMKNRQAKQADEELAASLAAAKGAATPAVEA